MNSKLSRCICAAALVLSVTGSAWGTLSNADIKTLETGTAKTIEQKIKAKKIAPNDKNKNGNHTALEYAMNNTNKGVVTALIKHGIMSI